MPFIGIKPAELIDDNVDLNGGTIDGTTIGGSTAAAGTFTNLTATGTLTLPDNGISGDDVNGGTISNFASTGIDDNATSTAITIDTNQNVGVGSTSPTNYSDYATLTLNDTQGGVLDLEKGGTVTGELWTYRDTNDIALAAVHAAGNIRIFTGGFTERMRIDSSGRTLVGKTSTSITTPGNEIVAGTFQASASSTSTNLATSSGGVLNLCNTSSTNGNFSNIGGYNSEGLVTSQIDFVNVSHSARTGDIVFLTHNGLNMPERMRIDSSGNVGIGESDPDNRLHVKQSADNSGAGLGIKIEKNANDSALFVGYRDNTDTWQINASYTSTGSFEPISFHTSDAERMRIDSNGVVLVGKTSFNYTSEGIAIEPDRISGVRNGTIAIWVRNTTDGEIFQFRKNTTAVGAINTRANQLAIGCTGTGLEFNDSNDAIIPFSPDANNTRDNALDLGMSSVRFDDIYATNGTIQTSDRNEKQDIEALSEAEQRVAVAAKALLRKFRWRFAVEERGDDARIHFGIIAQDLQAAFEAEGLDAGDYAMFIHTTWTDEETGEERDRMGIRYSELLAFIIAAI